MPAYIFKNLAIIAAVSALFLNTSANAVIYSIYSTKGVNPKAIQTEADFPTEVATEEEGISTTTIVAASGVAVLGVAIAIAAGGGGGSGNSGGSSAIDSYTTEYHAEGGLGQIKASAAYARGYIGKGIKVAVVDSGVDLSHPDLKANILPNSGNCIGSNGNVANCVTNTDGGTVGQDILGHGTHVAGIIAAKRNGIGMHGVAYEAYILPVRVLRPGEMGSSDFDIAAGIDYSTNNGAQIINLSLGGSDLHTPTFNTSPKEIKAISNAMRHDIIVVAATGNEGSILPGWPALGAGTYTNLNDKIATGAMIAVGSVDANNNISSFSNYCGAAKNWCLVAPGEYINSTVPFPISSNYNGFMSGTSMATPQVSGAAAIILAMSPGLTPRQAAEILLTTATDLGTAGVDVIYGHGLLNLDRATQPVGGTSIPLGSNINGASITVADSNINLASAFGDSLSKSGLQLAMLDSYDRAYSINLSSLTRTSDSFANFSNMVNSFGIGNMEKTVISENVTMAFENTAINTANTKEEDIKSNYRMALHSSNADSSMDINYNIPMSYAFSPSVLSGVDGSSVMGIDNTSFLNFVNVGISQLNSFNIGSKTSFRTGSFYSDTDKGNVLGFVNDIRYKFDKASVGLQIGMISEENTFLGSETQGAFALHQNTPTWFYNLSGNVPLPGKFNLYGSYNYGISFPDAASSSLFQDISEIQSYSFKIGINKTDSFIKGDKVDFVISQPLMVLNGSANLNLPLARDAGGNIARGNYNVNLSPTGREIDIGAFYSLDFADSSSSLSTGAIYRIQPNHVEDAKPDIVFMASYKYKF